MSAEKDQVRRDSRTLEEKLNDSWGEMGFNDSGHDRNTELEASRRASRRNSTRFSPMRRSRHFQIGMMTDATSSPSRSPSVPSFMPKITRRNSSWMLVKSTHSEGRHSRRSSMATDDADEDNASCRGSFALSLSSADSLPLPEPPLLREHKTSESVKKIEDATKGEEEQVDLDGKVPSSSAEGQEETVVQVVSSEEPAASRQDFAMRSIERGTDAWNQLLEPFVSDLVFRSIVPKRKGSKTGNVAFRPHHCQAALLFVDLSGYSKITQALAYAGAHAISDCVNSYLSRLVHVLKFHGGDVVKFAGDALMVVWAGDPSELEVNVFCAARAALILQKRCGVHPVQGTDHEFKIHCGLTCGTLDSEVFCAPKQNQCMPRLYHALSGETVEEIGALVDLAASGELCISQNCVSFLEGSGRYQDISKEKLRDFPSDFGAKLLEDLVLETDLIEYMDQHITATKEKNAAQRKALNVSIAEDFIHKSVLDALQHGGLSPTQIAQMRELCVLFIAMTSSGDAVNWLVEVQEILDRNRCPIVQIIQ